MDQSFLDLLLRIPDTLVDYYGSNARNCGIFYDISSWN